MDTHDEHEDDSAVRAGESELKISHFIPSVELTGSRTDKLEKLDTLITYLERLRRSLAGDTPPARGGFEGPSRYVGRPAWPWFTAGTLLGAVFVLLMMARGCGL